MQRGLLKTPIFNVWIDLIDKFLSEIATETASYSELSSWMNTDGAKAFRVAQGVHFSQHKAEYLQDADRVPPPVRMDLAYDQLSYGLRKTYEDLVKKFPCLESSTKQNFENFLKEALSEPFYPFIASRAVIATNSLKANEQDKSKALENVIKAYELLRDASNASIDAMKDAQPNLAVSSIARGPSSPVMHRRPQEQDVSADVVSQPKGLGLMGFKLL